jgi:predicted nucleotidyltransferase
MDSDQNLRLRAERQLASELADALRTQRAVSSACLFGSAARDEADSGSDLDLLVVASGDDVRGVRAELKRFERKGETQIRVMAAHRLRDVFEDRTVFATHLAREGRVFLDRDGLITALIKDYPKNAPVEEDGRALRARLKAYEDLAWCGGRYLLCLADLHAWGRSGAMLALGRLGRFEFSRDRLFAALVESYPGLAEAAPTVEALRPFWLTVRRKRQVSLPFPPDDSHTETATARDACQAILSVVP